MNEKLEKVKDWAVDHKMGAGIIAAFVVFVLIGIVQAIF